MSELLNAELVRATLKKYNSRLSFFRRWKMTLVSNVIIVISVLLRQMSFSAVDITKIVFLCILGLGLALFQRATYHWQLRKFRAWFEPERQRWLERNNQLMQDLKTPSDQGFLGESKISESQAIDRILDEFARLQPPALDA